MKDAHIPFVEILKLNTIWLGLSFMWNGLHQLILPAVLLNFVDYQKKNTTLGLLTFAGLLIAATIQPVSGTISDRWRSGWGRRRPLIFLGLMLNFIFLTVVAGAGGLLGIAVGYLGLQLTSNLAHGPAQGLLPDRVPPPQRGMASGIKNLMDMAGLLAAMVLLGRILDPEADHLLPAMFLVALFLAGGGAITLIGVRERPTRVYTQENLPQNVPAPAPGVRQRIPSYRYLLASRFFFLFGIYAVQGFIQYYIRDVMNVENPVKLTANLLALIIVALMVCALGGGLLGDRIGHKRVLYIASVVGGVGSVLLIWARTPAALLVYGSVFGAGLGLFLTSNWALANILAPAEQAGKFLGLSNLATAGAGAMARLTGPVIDILNNLRDGMHLGYTGLFVLGALATFASAVFLPRVDECLEVE